MEIKEQLEQMGKAFDEFKKTNETRLTEIKATGAAKAETETKLAKIESEMDKLQKSIDQFNAALNRTGGNGANEDAEAEQKKASAAYKSAFASYMHKGSEIPKEIYGPQYKEMSVDVDADGGFFVSPETSSEIVKKLYESNPMRQLASVQTIGTDALEILQDLDEAGSGWVGETGTRSTTSTPQVNKISIPVHELYAKPKATQKLLDDAAINIEAWLSGKVFDKFGRDESTAFLNGTGILKPKGILAYASGTSFGQIQRQATAANNAIVGEDLMDVQSLLKEGYQGNASWLINRLMIAIVRKLKDTVTGQYIWQPGLMVGAPNVLLGRPVYMATELPSAVTATTDTIIYGDIKAGYQIVDRIGIRVLRDPFSAKPYVEFYTTKRVGGGVKDFEAIKVLRIKT